MWVGEGEQLFARAKLNVLGGGGEVTQKEKRDEFDIQVEKVRVTGCVR